MAKVKLNWYIEGLQGKVADCGKEIRSHSITVNPYTGEAITRNNGVRNLTTHPYSAEELQKQAKFRATAALVKEKMADPNELTRFISQFRLQKEYKTIRGYIFAQLYPTVTV